MAVTIYQKDMLAVWKGIVENAKDAEVSKWVGSESFCWKIGNGKPTLFWWDIWCGNLQLKFLFPTLFRLAKNKVSTVGDSLSYSGNGSVNWEGWFSRPLLGREKGMCKDIVDKCEGELESASHIFFHWWDVVWKKVDGFVDFFALCNNVKMAEIHNEIMMQENFWWISPQRCQVVPYKSKYVTSFWKPPPLGWLKFNVCGIVKEDKVGCRGVLREMEGIARGIFSGAVDTNVVKEAEIGAVKITFEVFLSMNRKTNDSLFVELGSSVVFSWCINKFLIPWSLHAIFSEIETSKLKAGSVIFSLTDWNGNDIASHWRWLVLTGRKCLKLGGDILFG
ncbi:hypothetical protein CXB51_009978 [Gossypium anomalum]|uniref:Reverse transcriptase zinc-binding domain-containing protein n=1 Tax=Gossypium anomalum TaxID=47600 RepID=A0A8J5YMA8_9ROSI|nr:hypothetical protein CXB51_009978 [Gossypium anomalum]